jgi:hypothetical protein
VSSISGTKVDVELDVGNVFPALSTEVVSEAKIKKIKYINNFQS